MKSHENRPGIFFVIHRPAKKYFCNFICIFATRSIYTEAQQNSFDPKNVMWQTRGFKKEIIFP